MRIIVAHGADESIDGPKGRRKTDVQQLKTVTDFEGHRAGSTRSWPLQHSVVERLR